LPPIMPPKIKLSAAIADEFLCHWWCFTAFSIRLILPSMNIWLENKSGKVSYTFVNTYFCGLF
jgi:hypothetical protein